MNVYEFASRHFGKYRIEGKEIKPLLCPYCQGGQHHDKETFALNVDKQTFNCKRGKCGKQGHFTELCRDFGERADTDQSYIPIKKYKKPETVINELGNQAEEYLKLRKINKETMLAYKIGCDDTGNIVFPYYQNNELVFVKFRPARKVEKGERKAWRESDTKPILFGMDLCNTKEPLIIFEGEIDAMSGYEAGLRNCVSVPSGAEDLTWVDTCWDWVKQFDKIFFFGDNDEPGRAMIDKLCIKFEDKHLYTVQNQYKDCNELLYKEGKQAVKTAVDNSKSVPMEGILDFADIANIDIRRLPKTKANFSALDRITGGFRYGELSVWTGKRGSGKSTFIGQLLLETVEQGVNVFAYSGELNAIQFQHWVMLQAAGTDICKYYDNVKGKEMPYVADDTKQKIVNWLSGKFYLYDNQKMKDLLYLMEYAAKRYDCKVFLVDNLMTAGRTFSNSNDYYRMQSEYVGQLADFSKRFNVHVHLVAHPRKNTGNSSDENDDVGGSGDITNRADNVFRIDKAGEEEGCNAVLKVLKNRFYGETGEMGLIYNERTRRMFNADKEYCWKDEGEWWENGRS